jgi:hypothetical protein
MQKLFCLGLSRTGTTSLSEVLNHVGILTIHYIPQLFVQQDFLGYGSLPMPANMTGFFRRWMYETEVSRYSRRPISETMMDYQGFTDLPVPLYFRELDVKYPNSKFILTERSEESWLASMKWMFEVGRVLWNWGPIEDQLLQKTYGTVVYKPMKLIEAYRTHRARVLRYFSMRPGDLLTIDISQGDSLERLYEFLGVRDPDRLGTFPRINQSRTCAFTDRWEFRLRRALPFLGYVYHKLVNRSGQSPGQTTKGPK